MSRSSSMGDLVPRDITEVLALQSKVNKGKKKRGSSLGRAFSWFKGNKQKRSVSNGQSRSASLAGRTGECATIRQGQTNHESSKVGQKQDEQKKLTVHYTASQHYQENVFIEGSRPKYLEDLHTEAQEGLKILQQEEHNNGMDLKDDQTVSTDTPQEKDASCQESDGRLDFDNTADHSSHITSVSSRPAVSSRPVLTRQGSTFKPLNTVKRLDKTRKRTRRTTIMGIPQQVQRELCMGRGVLLQQVIPNGDDPAGTVIIPTIDGGAPLTNHEGAHVHLQDIEALQASREEQLLRHHIQAVYRDDLLLNCKLGSRTSPMQRPKSLAVPGMTTSSSFLQEQGPVMSISPQATYLSTIIPNAVLPAAIDVIEIDRSRSRRSVRTVSKSSLASASPGSSRSGGGTHDAPPSYSSKRSYSQSSETIVSNSSTVSLKGNAVPSHAADRMKEELNHEEQISVKSSSSWLSSSTKAASLKLEQGEPTDAGESIRNSQFSRSLSIMKAKLPPAPPRRTYSLHQEKLKQRSRELDDKKNELQSNGEPMNGGETSKKQPALSNHENISTNSTVTAFLDDSHLSLTFSPHSPDQDSTDAQTGSGNSSPQNKFERTMSPSSGYSSQSGTPTHSSKDLYPTSPAKHKKKPPKPERTGPRTSPVVSVSSSTNSLSSAATDPAPLSSQTHTTQSQPPKVCPTVTAVTNKATPAPTGSALRELFNIPPPPKVKAPCPPPPETWAHNKHTVNLLCGPSPCPNRIYGLQKQHKDSILIKNQDTTNHTGQTSLEKHISVEMKNTEPHTEDKEVTIEVKNEKSMIVLLDETPAKGHTESSVMHEKEEESCPERETVSCVIKKQEEKMSEDLKTEQESAVTSEKVLSGNVNQKVQQNYELNTCDLQDSDTSTPKLEKTDTDDQDFNAKHWTDKEIPAHRPKENLVKASRVIGKSPPPSPPPAHHPPPPPSKKSPASSVSTPLTQEELQPDNDKEYPVLECSWPPPPPPMDESADLVFEGQDEVDFPPPPPLLMQELLSDMSENCNLELSRQGDTMATEDSSHVPDVRNPVEHDLSKTMPEKTRKEQPTVVNALINGPEVSEDKSFDQSPVKPLSSEDGSQASQSQAVPLEPEDLSPSPHNDQPNPSLISVNHLSQQAMSETPALTTDVPVAPPLPTEEQSTLNFRRQPSLTSKDNRRDKELLPRHKSAPIPKEDANIPLVTPSLLQMVRLRSVNVEDQVNTPSQDEKPNTEETPGQDQVVVSQVTPQKPIRKSCLKSTQPSVKSSPAAALGPSMRLQEAIRMKTAAMSSSGVPARLNLRSTTSITNSNDTVPVPSPKTSDSCDLLKSPASTASFIFSKSTKKVVIETPTSPELQATLKQSLAAELMQISDQAKSLEAKKHVKVPPPVAKKPAHATNPFEKLGTGTALTSENSSSKPNDEVENGQIETVQPAGQRAQSPGTKMPASTTETARILEVS
ncbi:NHS-like protein 3 [Salminus brasiliensis]|uniref:NHS-like protein 3 n=1 Tax=Salminus brasiliensis TaxID=930266 RepID=UPI003B83204E